MDLDILAKVFILLGSTQSIAILLNIYIFKNTGGFQMFKLRESHLHLSTNYAGNTHMAVLEENLLETVIDFPSGQ